jgi:alpha-L-fucosidase
MTFRDDFLQGGQLGQFFHFGPYAALGRGEQALWRERLDQTTYRRQARAWRPQKLDVGSWCDHAVAMGADYAVLTTRHHDAYCLWPTAEHDYHSQACFDRDIVDEFVTACRQRGLRVGLYYSLADWTCPAYFSGPETDQSGFNTFIEGIFQQVRELLTNYGTIDIIWFDACTPHDSDRWRSHALVQMIRGLQPGILINSRLGTDIPSGPPQLQEHIDGGCGPGDSDHWGDFSVGEGRILSQMNRPWETCATSTRARWGYSAGEAWRTPHEIIEECLKVLTTGGNYMLNVGPDGDGCIPPEYTALMDIMGPWLRSHRAHLHRARPWEDMTFVNRGWLYHASEKLLVVLRSWDGSGSLQMTDFDVPPLKARLLGLDCSLTVTVSGAQGERCLIEGLPHERPTPLFPTIELTFAASPQATPITARRNWSKERGNWLPFTTWAAEGLSDE